MPMALIRVIHTNVELGEWLEWKLPSTMDALYWIANEYLQLEEVKKHPYKTGVGNSNEVIQSNIGKKQSERSYASVDVNVGNKINNLKWNDDGAK